MKLNELKPHPKSTEGRKRLGRGHGSGLGKTSGRGHKGQRARSGGRVGSWFEGGQMPLQRRLPKSGFINTLRTRWTVVNLLSLNRIDGTTEIDPQSLVQNGVISSAKHPVKILGKGDLKKALKIKAHAFSESAQEKIKKAGGSFEIIAWSVR
jgi:large subunit ribosomal protein L15